MNLEKKLLIALFIMLILAIVLLDSISKIEGENIIREEAKDLCLERSGISDIRVGHNYCIINNTKYDIKGNIENNEIQYMYFEEVIARRGIFT